MKTTTRRVAAVRPAASVSKPKRRPGDAAEREPHILAKGIALRSALLLPIASIAFLPLAELLHTDVQAPGFLQSLSHWVIATLLVLLVACGVAYGLSTSAVLSRWSQALSGAVERHWLAVTIGLCAFALLAYGIASTLIFDRLPINVDEMAQARQTNIFLTGRLWAGTPEPAEFFSSFLMVDADGKTFSQFPPGWPVLLALGELLNLRWLMGPLMGAAALAGMILVARAAGESRRFALGCALLLAASPWFLLNASSYMSHTATVALLLLGSAALLRAVAAERRAVTWAGVAGLILGCAAAIRPVDALAFSVPAFAWLAWRAVRSAGWKQLAVFVVGAALPVGLLLVFNAATTGHALRLGYVTQWGAGHGLGFHDSPWGPPHTPARGIASLNAYLRGMQIVMFESPVPALLAPLVALLLTRSFRAADRFLLTASGLLALAYLSYWYSADQNGDYLGPRYMLPLAPVAVLWTLRLPRALSALRPTAFVKHASILFIALMVVAGWPGAVSRIEYYAQLHPARRIEADALTREQGISNALILIPVSWIDQIFPRLWARGVSRPESERLFRSIDVCLLELTLSDLERRDVSGQRAVDALRRVASGDQARFVAESGEEGLCRERARAERRGSWSLQPFQLAREHDNIFARDLNQLTEKLLAEYPDRPVYVARPDPVLGLEHPVFVPFKADSAREAWFLAGTR